jgi:hypothetical protein
MWCNIDYSNETIDNLKKGMQRLLDEGKRLMAQDKILEQSAEEQTPHDHSHLYQMGKHPKASGGKLISRICRNLHY